MTRQNGHDSGFALVFRATGELLVLRGDVPRLPGNSDPVVSAIAPGPILFHGRVRGPANRAAWGPDDPPDGCEYRSLRELLTQLDAETAAMARRARQLLEWDRDHQFCGRCGTATTDKADEHAKRCPSCDHTAYPRIHPAIIVAITYKNTLLLARNKLFKNNMHSLIAGFVEPGESLEDAVRREVAEEVNLTLGALRYFGSQSWPFPTTLMLGFLAEYASGELHVDGTEIVEAGWYTIGDMPPIPPHGSLSRQLIEHVLQTQLQERG